MLLETPFRTQDLDAIAKAVTAGMATAKVAGPSVAIAKDGRLLFAAGFGKANPRPASSWTFGTGSASAASRRRSRRRP